MSTKNKHKAIVLVQDGEVHQLLDTGECSGKPVSKDKLEEYGIKFPFVIEMEGFDQHDCLIKLKNRLERLKNG